MSLSSIAMDIRRWGTHIEVSSETLGWWQMYRSSISALPVAAPGQSIIKDFCNLKPYLLKKNQGF